MPSFNERFYADSTATLDWTAQHFDYTAVKNVPADFKFGMSIARDDIYQSWKKLNPRAENETVLVRIPSTICPQEREADATMVLFKTKTLMKAFGKACLDGGVNASCCKIKPSSKGLARYTIL